MAMTAAQTFLQSIYEMLMQSQHWPPEQMRDFQRSQLTQLLRHAKANVPFYRTRLDCVFKKNGDIDWDRWNEIPIVTRAELRDNYEAMRAIALPAGHGPTKTFRSSGSSGIPIKIETTGIMSIANEAAAFRFLENQKIDMRKIRANISSYTPNGDLLRDEYFGRRWGKPWLGANASAPDFIINRDLPDRQKLQLIDSLGVSYLQDITNNAAILGQTNLLLDKPIKLEALICVGQKLDGDRRDLFQRSFGARSLSIYSSKEAGLMGCQCGESSFHHINDEIVCIEAISDDGHECGFGNEGRVIVTPFFSTSMPLIRYDQGDSAELHRACDCGHAHPILKNITGRQDQLLKFPDGPRAVGVLFQRLMEQNLEVLAFQLAQVATFKLELRYIPRHADTEIAAAPIVAHIHELVHRDLEVAFVAVDKLPLNSGGKQQRVVCEI
jgi:phenylacetate-CoA ligase